MAFDSLGQFVAALRRADELREVRARVDPHLEIAEITDRVVKAGGPALLFSNVAGSKFAVLTNQFGTERRMAMAFGAKSLEEVADRLRGMLDLSVPHSAGGRLEKFLKFGSMALALPLTVTSAPVQEVVETEPDLRKLPILTTWPLDGGPFITLPLVFTKDPRNGTQNAAAWGRNVPVAVAIGADPAITYAATAPLPPIVDEILFAGFLRGRGVRMTACKTVDLKVPADAEIVLEGYVDNEDLRVEGPFGDHTGVYSLADRYPTFHITCITRRTVVGKPPMEDAWLGKATERIFLPLLQMVVPEIVDYNLPVEGGFHNLCIVSIKKAYPGHAKKVMNALWGLGHMMMLTRCLIVVDADIDVHDVRQVAWYVLNNLDPSRDLVIMPGPVDDLDHSGPSLVSLGHKLGVDATRKSAEEGYARAWPPDIVMDEATRRLVTQRWSEYGLRAIESVASAWSGQGGDALRRLLAGPPLVAASPDATALRGDGV